MTFGQLILRKIIKIVATRSQILKLNAPKSISAGALPHTALGSLHCWIRGDLLLRKGEGCREGEEEEG